VPVLALLALDLAEAPVGTVVGLDRPLERVVDLVDLAQNLLGLGPFGGDGARVCGRSADGEEKGRNDNDDAARLFAPRTNYACSSSRVQTGEPGGRTGTSSAP